MAELSVIICAHNSHPGRLARTLAGLHAQTLPSERWELLLVDNASTPPLVSPTLPRARLICENRPGLTYARRRGIRKADAPIAVFVDDDNVLAPDYLAQVLAIFAAHPTVGAIGGKSVPEFETPPEPWAHEFLPLLALRDPGDAVQLSPDSAVPPKQYPLCAPIGAGMALRTSAVRGWLDRTGPELSDRRGTELTSSGDNDIVLAILSAGWRVGYFPALSLIHLIPAGRLTRDYLARLNRGIALSWVQVLALYGISPWPRIHPATLPLRRLKAWLACRAWRGPAAYIRWQGACGHFAGRAAFPS
ncbi:MAG: glycosyltransferase family 2 protein [Verrucomicrobia bacterium]|nr:glycosyltransferase family 2 protein [Verrucomicrobiota bacterium]